MRKIPNSSRRLDEHISRALNKIRKPSTAEEITELLNRDLEPEDRPFRAKEVAVSEHRGHGVDTVLVKDSPPQIALLGGNRDHRGLCPTTSLFLIWRSEVQTPSPSGRD
jgi:hypothetical protein